ncbi:MAG: NADH-ubiquinone oxidoreductase [Acholeplasma sp.]|jgi:multicomponent Na+:H+ antiporter subunit D|nr:MAG: NADH-ubiquinone oxidoreductase [Acholeplasma sp.]
MSPIYLIAIPLLLAFLSIISKKTAPYLAILGVLFNSVAVWFITKGIVNIGGFELPYGINLYVDTYTLFGLAIVNLLFLGVVLIHIKEEKAYASTLLVALVGLNGLLLTGDLFNLFVFLEISGIAAYILTTSNKKPYRTFQYLVMGSIGSSLYLFGLIILYGMVGSLNLMHIVHLIQDQNIAYANLILPFMLMFIGLGVEAKLLPFNAWVRGILAHANGFVGSLIASVYAAAISFVFGRLILNLFQFEGRVLLIVTILLVLGVILGEAMAFASSKARETLLYSSIAQASIVMLLFVQGMILWAAYLIIANALAKFVLFTVIGHASKNQDDELNSLSGLFQKHVIVGVATTIATLSMIGLPLFVGFIIKVNYLMALATQNQFFIIAILILSAVVEGIYFIRLLIKLWFPEAEVPKVKYAWGVQTILVMIALGLLVLGTYREPLDQFTDGIDQITEEIEVLF